MKEKELENYYKPYSSDVVKTVDIKVIENLIEKGVAVNHRSGFSCPKCGRWEHKALMVTKSEFRLCDPGYDWVEVQECLNVNCGCVYVINNGV